MDLPAQGLAHLAAADVGNGVEGQAVEQFVVVQQVFAYAVDDEVQKFVLLVQKERHRQVANLLFRVFGGRDEVDGLEVAKVDIPAEDVNVEELSLAVFCLGSLLSYLTLQTYFFLW